MADDVKIYEDNHSKTVANIDIRDLMTEEQQKRGKYYQQKYLQRRGELDNYKEEFDEIQKLYSCERDPDPTDPKYPNNFIPLLAPAIEGQVASMMESGIEYNYSSNNPSHQQYLPKLEAASAYCREINKAELHYKDYARSVVGLGNGWITVCWEKSYSTAKDKPDGYPRIMIPPLMSVLVDGRIKDYKDLQHAAYIIHEIGFQDIAWARREYGDKIADGIARSTNRYDGIDTEAFADDTDTFTLLHVWTRDNEKGNLQLIEMDTTGFILRESDPSKPYYKTVDNEYPFYFGRMIPRQGKFYGYGDGKILKYMQKFINNLADELEIACRNNAQPKTFVDLEKAEMDTDQFDSDPSHPIACKQPNQNILVVQGQGVSNVILQAIQFTLDQAQRAIRVSDIMSGTQQGVSATATQINGQLTQGSVGIRDKASDIQRAMAWCDRYCIRLCLENWKVPFWVGKFRDTSDVGGSSFLDMPEMARVPAVVPASGDALMERMAIKAENPNAKVVDYDSAYDKKGDAIYVDLDYNVEVKLSAGFPRGKNDLFNQIVAMLQMQALDADGQIETMISMDVARAKLEEIVGFKLAEKKELASPPIPINNGAVNPLGEGGEVAMPQGAQIQTQPSNLMGTVPLAKDNRSMSL